MRPRLMPRIRRHPVARGFGRAVRPLLVLAAIATVLAVGGAYAESDGTCSGCHDKVPPIVGSHQGATCVACHRPTGLAGGARHAVGYGRMLYAGLVERQASPAAGPATTIDQSACTRCHEAVFAEDADDLRPTILAHAHLRDLGIACARCHQLGAHFPVDASLPSRPPMSECLGCHDGRQAEAECVLCHRGRPSDGASSRRVLTPSAPTGESTCRPCHEDELNRQCVACHGGYEMPHPAGWTERQHLLPGMTDKDGCMECHEGVAPDTAPAPHGSSVAEHGGGFCNRCHTFPSPHGASGVWQVQHGPASRGAAVSQPVCEPCHSGSFVSDCLMCHSQTTCDTCHAAR